jgi:hypothetical protein
MFFIQMNSDIEDNTLIGENSVIREEVKIRIKYTKKYADLWRNIQKITKKYYNKKHRKVSFALDGGVLLGAKGFVVRRLYRGFSGRYIGSFRVFGRGWGGCVSVEFA